MARHDARAATVLLTLASYSTTPLLQEDGLGIFQTEKIARPAFLSATLNSIKEIRKHYTTQNSTPHNIIDLIDDLLAPAQFTTPISKALITCSLFLENLFVMANNIAIELPPSTITQPIGYSPLDLLNYKLNIHRTASKIIHVISAKELLQEVSQFPQLSASLLSHKGFGASAPLKVLPSEPAFIASGRDFAYILRETLLFHDPSNIPIPITQRPHCPTCPGHPMITNDHLKYCKSSGANIARQAQCGTRRN